MYSQFFYYTQKEEEKRRAIMRIPRKSGEQIEVDGAGDPAQLIDPDTGEIAAAWILVGVLTYSQYAFVRVRKPKNKPNVESSVGKISTWITAALRNERFFSLAELNAAVRKKLDAYNARKFLKKDCSRLSLFLGKEAIADTVACRS